MGSMKLTVFIALSALLLCSVNGEEHPLCPGLDYYSNVQSYVGEEGFLLRWYIDWLDKDGDGLASFDEWVTMVALTQADWDEMNKLPEMTNRLLLVKPSLDMSPESVFATYDHDGDGYLSFEDMVQEMEISGNINMLQPGNLPMEIHVSLLDSTTASIVWVTMYNTTDLPFVNYAITEAGADCSGVALSEQNQGETYTYEAGCLGWNGMLHRVLVNAKPGEQICYQVGNIVSESNSTGPVLNPTVFYFHLPSSAIGGSRIAVYGDMGTFMFVGWRVARQILSYIEENGNFDLVIHAGDLAYAGVSSDREWEGVWDLFCNQIQGYAAYSPYQTTVGNHESYFNYTSYKNRFYMPGEIHSGEGDFYYSYDYQGVHFVSICTEDGVYPYAPGSPQYAWLENDLAMANANRNVTPWLIVSGHRPMYSSNKQTDSGDLRVDVEPLFYKYGVDLYLAGHMHDYERTFPVYNNTVTESPLPSSLDPVTTTYSNPNATTHITVGTGGAFVSYWTWENPRPDWSAFRRNRYGFGTLLIHNSTHLEWQFQDVYAGLVDDLWIVKNENNW